jgi:hypothetical protein
MMSRSASAWSRTSLAGHPCRQNQWRVVNLCCCGALFDLQRLILPSDQGCNSARKINLSSGLSFCISNALATCGGLTHSVTCCFEPQGASKNECEGSFVR